jgi:serine/threonine-protein kinase
MQYKGTTKNIREIGEELGVATLVEGEVQRVGDRVRIRAQLIDARADEHVWSEQYERQLTDVFAIQSDIAQRVAAGLRATLTDAEREAIQQKPTDNLEAHEYYVSAIELSERSELEEDWRLALRLTEKAVELDPRFAQAWALQSELHTLLYVFRWDRSEERLAKAKSAAFEAFELRAGLGEAHRALGVYYFLGFWDYEPALDQFSLALKRTPNDARTWYFIARVQERQGRWQESVDSYTKAVELNPRAAAPVASLADSYALHFEEKAWLYLEWQGSTEKARAELEEQSLVVGSVEDRPIGYRWQPFIELFERDYSAALERLSLASLDNFESWAFYFVPKALLYAQVYGLMGQSERELAYYDSARAILETELEENTEDHRLHGSLGIAYAGLGRRDDAIREAKLGVELMPVERRAWEGTYRVEDLARVYVMVGEYDAGIDQLDYLLSIPGEISVPLLRIDPTWDSLRGHPRFQAMLAKYE